MYFSSTQIKASTLKRYDTGDSDNFSQSKTFYKDTLKEDEKARLASNIADSLFGANTNLQNKAVSIRHACLSNCTLNLRVLRVNTTIIN